jgi:hypothetical protein
MIAPLVLIGLALAALRLVQRLWRRHPAQAVIISPRKSTEIGDDGAVRSVQSAQLTLAPTDLAKIWSPANLENLARTYWLFLSRVTLGLVRVVYDDDSRSVVLIARPLTLLRFEPPEYTIDAGDRAAVRWRIRDGLLVTRSGRGCGFLELDVERLADDEEGRARLLIEVEVANFYPSIAAGFSTPVYRMTQSVVHVLVTHSFLRSLAALQLAKSKIGALADRISPF